MITKAFAHNLAAIGMADLIQRAYLVAIHCKCRSADCCQEKNLDTFGEALENLGGDPFKRA